jgi:DNA polymerase I-like protein with 3'-5' exonuclease and polymerase domains
MTTLISTWHPTYAMFKNPFSWGEFKIDLDRFSRAISGNLRPGPSRILKAPRPEDVAKVASYGYVCVDIETAPADKLRPWTAKDPLRAEMRCVGVGNHDWGLAQMWRGKRKNLATMNAMQNLCADPKIKKVFHNGIWFDRPIMKRYGFTFANVEDTRDARRALSSTSRLGLKYLGTIYDDPIPWAEKEEDEDEKVIFTRNIDDLLTYNVYDTVEDARVWQGMLAEPEWSTKRVQNLYRYHLNTSQIAANMRARGMWIDAKERKRLSDHLEKLYDEREKKVLQAVNIDGFKCTPNHMRALIFKRHERDDIKRFSLEDPIDKKMWNPDGDTIKVDQSTLLLLYVDPGVPKELKDIIDLYWEAESAWKARSTFVSSPSIDRAIGDDGFLRPEWNSCGADTGRWSCRRPNVMTIPKDTEEDSVRGELPNIRRMYAAQPGFVLIEELRVMAAIAKDEVLMAALAKGDVYTEDAKDIFKLPAHFTKKDIKPQSRQLAKTVHLGYQYGAGTNALYMQCLETDRTLKYGAVQMVHDGMKKRYWRTVQYWEEEQARVRKTGYSETRILNRRRYYPREPPVTETANYPIQGTAADITGMAMIEIEDTLAREIPKGGIICQVHDSILLAVPDQERIVNRAIAITREIMSRPVEIEGERYSLPVDIKKGYNWADLKEVKAH